mmetsp:Transcript_7919/g.18653  ORF Transcript_7919/g.18653 Transcript_7919/m.18653 type:complete len:500 (-) Transcript_7919:104-1603(-)
MESPAGRLGAFLVLWLLLLIEAANGWDTQEVQLQNGVDAWAMLQTRAETFSGESQGFFPTGHFELTPRTKRQELENFDDTQYFANITIGGQVIAGIIDTGSFELVVFEAHCDGCGRAGKYNSQRSHKHSKGRLNRGLYYGSGDVYASEAFDEVSIGPFPPIMQSFWQAYEATMAVLQTARFQSIIGIGPPEMPHAEAWTEVAASVKDIMTTVDDGDEMYKWQEERVKTRMDFFKEVRRTPTMVASYKITSFSMCLRNEPGSRGYFIWNDTSALDMPTLFRRVQVLGRNTWTVNMTGVHLTPRSDAGLGGVLVGCAQGCGAIIDSGTSLLMMPSDIVNRLDDTLQRMGVLNCTDMDELPDIAFWLDGKIFSLPPDAYLAETVNVPENMLQFARVRALGNAGRCRLSVMESYSTTHWGPLWILGMPFFRRYYTTFQLGRSRAERALYMARASPECEPVAHETRTTFARGNDRMVYRRRLSLSHPYLSPIVKKAMQGGLVDL